VAGLVAVAVVLVVVAVAQLLLVGFQ